MSRPGREDVIDMVCYMRLSAFTQPVQISSAASYLHHRFDVLLCSTHNSHLQWNQVDIYASPKPEENCVRTIDRTGMLVAVTYSRRSSAVPYVLDGEHANLPGSLGLLVPLDLEFDV